MSKRLREYNGGLFMKNWQQILIAFSVVFVGVVLGGLLMREPEAQKKLQPLQQNTPPPTSMIQSNSSSESIDTDISVEEVVTKQEWYKDQVLVLMYHHISDKTDKRFSISPQLFAEHMKFLHENDIHPITLAEFLRFVDTGVLPTNNAVLLTFDDGYESYYTEAYPVMKKYNFPSVNFVIAGRLRDTLERKRENMTTPLTVEQISEMQSSGLVDIASHTYSLHDQAEKEEWGALDLESKTAPVFLEDLRRIEEDQEYRNRLFVDFTMSRVALADLIKKPIDVISLPHGYQNQQVIETAKEAGYDYIFNSRPAIVKPGVSSLDIPRFGVGSELKDVTKLRQLFMDAKLKQ